ncbi:MAG: hypothetical protein HYX65_01955 [Gemmatimonadetes bacterium]|nr:hypothetical protein [Gemmatimonadota bacterium]
MRLLALAACVAAVFASPIPTRAQDKLPPRPRLAADQDTNDAQSYLLYAVANLDKDPRLSQQAYYWASRIDPNSGQAIYGRAITTLLADDGLLRMSYNGPRNDRDRSDLRAIDSLYLLATILDPFLHRNLQRRIFMAQVTAVLGGRASQAAIWAAVEDEMRRGGPAALGYAAYTESKFPAALDYYREALEKAKTKSYFYKMRGEMFWLIGNADSAMAQFKLAIQDQKKIEDKKVVILYQPKAVYEYQLGWIHEREGRTAEAKEAYGRALVEDLSFYPAHVRIGALALEAGDTATAVSEFDLAAQAAPKDAKVKYQNGYVLALTRRLAEASHQLQEAIALEPWYAEPRLLLARLYEASDMADLAGKEYDAFLQRSAQSDLQRAFAQERITVLRGVASKPRQ